MNGLLLNIILALAWVALSGDFTPGSFGMGFAIGFVLLLFSQSITAKPGYVRKVWSVLDLFFYMVYEIIISNLRVAIDVVRPLSALQPGIIAVPLDATSDTEIFMLVNMIMLTPGTLAIDVSSNRRELYLHIMDARDPEKLRAQIKQGFERRVLEVLR
jgi:multicomponent Na+:H+ antiporter subunit E